MFRRNLPADAWGLLLTCPTSRQIIAHVAFAKRARMLCRRARTMKPAPFRYIAARSLEQALALKAEYGDEARFLAGGQSLVPTMNFRLTQPAVLIDINPLTQLSGMQKSGPDNLHIGALTRYRELERDPATP